MSKVIFIKRNYLSLQIFLIISTFSFSHSLVAQSSREELVKRYLNIGKQLVQLQNYDSAYITLKQAFIKGAVLPDELLYFYGLVLYKRGDIDQGYKYVNKYIAIVKTDAEYYQSAMELKRSIEDEIDKQSITCVHCEGKGYLTKPCEACHQTGQQVCSVCKGKKRVLVGADYGMKLGQCPTCSGKGVTNCDVCKGTQELRSKCEVCNGKGKIRKLPEAQNGK